MPTYSKTLETPSGRGKLFRGTALIAEPRYSLRVTQVIHVSRTLDGSTGETEGLKKTTGQIEVERHVAGPLLGEDLVLELTDGRRLPIFLKNSEGEIAPRGGFEEK